METAYDKQMKNECYHLQKERNYEIDWFRIAPYRLLSKPTYYIAMRCILINSFAFLTIIYDESDAIKIIQLSREEIENKDYSQIVYAQKSYLGNKEDLEDSYQFFEVSIDGYDDEKIMENDKGLCRLFHFAN
ncbi:MAG: hypothetical protein K2O16_03635 [Lachnospiraceae bacterium]|nr:hypothetical protein [Lachnospiraceae bacterium]